MKLFERIEHLLEKHGQYNLTRKLQRFESHFVSKKRNEAQCAWASNNNKATLNAFSLLQREIYLKEELSALSKLQGTQYFTQDEKERIKRWQEELETFDERHWLHMRAYYEALLNKPKGPWIRYWDISRKEYFYFSEEMVLRCKAKGGCCESDCGCCRRSLKTTRDHNGIRGHCTMECGCCIRRRGFYKPSEQKNN
jgi:hypothetical protein